MQNNNPTPAAQTNDQPKSNKSNLPPIRMGGACDMDVAQPHEVLDVLDSVVEKYVASSAELEAMWQDPAAGAIWSDFAAILQRARRSMEKAITKRGF